MHFFFLKNNLWYLSTNLESNHLHSNSCLFNVYTTYTLRTLCSVLKFVFVDNISHLFIFRPLVRLFTADLSDVTYKSVVLFANHPLIELSIFIIMAPLSSSSWSSLYQQLEYQNMKPFNIFYTKFRFGIIITKRNGLHQQWIKHFNANWIYIWTL